MGASSKDNMNTHGQRMAHAVGTNKYNINVKMAVAVDGTIIFIFFYTEYSNMCINNNNTSRNNNMHSTARS